MARYRFSGLQGRLALVVLLAVLPLLTLLLYGNWELRQIQRGEAEDEVLSLVTLATNEQDRLIEGARQLLTGLAQLPQLQDEDPAPCREFLSGLLQQYRVYSNLGMATPDGDVRCLARPVGPSLNVADRPYFRESLAERRFTMGEYQIGRFTGRPIVAFAQPVIVDGEVRGVLLAALDVRWLGTFLEQADLPPGSTINAIDVEGRVLVRYPDPEAWVGRRLPELPLVRSILESRGEAVTTADGLDGVPRVYAHGPLPALHPERTAFLSVGVPTSAVFAETRVAFVRNLLGIALALLIAGVAVGLGGRWLVIRPVVAVVRAMRLYARGHRDSRAPVLTRDEIGEVARAFNEMANDLDAVHAELEHRVEERTDALNRALEKVEERHRTLLALLEKLPVGVFITRADGTPELVNREGAAIMGLKSDDPEGMVDWQDEYGFETEEGDPYPVEDLPLSRTLATGEPASAGDIHMVRPDGTRVAVRASSAAIRGARGELKLAVVVFEDMTRERQLERAKDEFVALASHQLRTPATGVKAYLSMLLDGDAGRLEPLQEEFVARAHESNEQGLALIEDLLAVSRIDSGRYVAEIEPIDLGALVEDVVEEQRETIRVRGQEVRYERPASPMVTPVDPRKIRMAVGNLVDNASKYTTRGGRVEVSVSRANGSTVIVVEDDGVGIEAGDLGKLFRRFSRIDHARADEVGGTGLGLYLVKQIVDLHHGEVEVESEPGEGTTFTIRLRSA